MVNGDNVFARWPWRKQDALSIPVKVTVTNGTIPVKPKSPEEEVLAAIADLRGELLSRLEELSKGQERLMALADLEDQDLDEIEAVLPTLGAGIQTILGEVIQNGSTLTQSMVDRLGAIAQALSGDAALLPQASVVVANPNTPSNPNAPITTSTAPSTISPTANATGAGGTSLIVPETTTPQNPPNAPNTPVVPSASDPNPPQQ